MFTINHFSISSWVFSYSVCWYFPREFVTHSLVSLLRAIASVCRTRQLIDTLRIRMAKFQPLNEHIIFDLNVECHAFVKLLPQPQPIDEATFNIELPALLGHRHRKTMSLIFWLVVVDTLHYTPARICFVQIDRNDRMNVPVNTFVCAQCSFIFNQK